MLQTEASRDVAQTYFEIQGETGDLVPQRAAFTARRCKTFISQMSLLQRAQTDSLSIRLCGTGLATRTGQDVTGADFADLFPPDEARLRILHLCALLEAPCGATTILPEHHGDTAVALELISFPVADVDQGASLVLTVTSPIEEDVRADTHGPAQSWGEAQRMHLIDIGAGTNGYFRSIRENSDLPES